MHLDELDLEIPAELVAQTPMQPRDACRLMVVDPVAGTIVHNCFRDLPQYLRSGDVLVINDSRVIAARLWVHKATGGRVELLFLHPCAGADGLWEVLARPSGRLRPGQALRTPRGREVRLATRLGEGRWYLGLEGEPGFRAVLEEEGALPLPPYIKTPLTRPDDYQTVYAQSEGSAAAPTAGLHFTPELLTSLRAGGVGMVPVTLHVGIDTFRPVTEECVEEHHIHQEAYDVPPDSLARLDAARAEGRRLVAVGTTAVRVLETLYRDAEPGAPSAASPTGWTGLFITPGHRFRAVDAMVTNFHLPRTSLLALVMAFAGLDVIRNAYAEAVRERYRVYSFGDAILITRPQGRRPERAYA